MEALKKVLRKGNQRFLNKLIGRTMKKIENQLIFIFKVSGNPVTWATKKQGLATTAITKAECVAAWMACKEGIWLTKLENRRAPPNSNLRR